MSGEVVQNQPFDEAFEVSSHGSPEPPAAGEDDGDGQPQHSADFGENSLGDHQEGSDRFGAHDLAGESIREDDDDDDHFGGGRGNSNNNNFQGHDEHIHEDSGGDDDDDDDDDDLGRYRNPGDEAELAHRPSPSARPQSRREARPGSSRGGLSGRPGGGGMDGEAMGDMGFGNHPGSGPGGSGGGSGGGYGGDDGESDSGEFGQARGGRVPSPEPIPGLGDADENSGVWDSPQRGYDDASAYTHIDAPPEVLELFGKIERYEPHTIDLDTRLAPFIPDYLPAVGDLDPFIKVDRPDLRSDPLGLSVLDEPATVQSVPEVLRMRLAKGSKRVTVDGAEGAAAASSAAASLSSSVSHDPMGEAGGKQIDAWVHSIEDLHRSNPAPQVTYTAAMPDVESLMQVWPAEYENLLEAVGLPGAELDVTTEEYARLVCALADIPVRNNLIESLHALFCLYGEFEQNQHFQSA